MSKLKLHEIVKIAGLDSLSELSRMTKRIPETLRNWDKKYPKLMEIVILGAVEKKRRDKEK